MEKNRLLMGLILLASDHTKAKKEGIVDAFFNFARYLPNPRVVGSRPPRALRAFAVSGATWIDLSFLVGWREYNGHLMHDVGAPISAF